MKNFHFQKCGLEDWQLLQKVSIQTFTDTYQDKNDPKNFQCHIITAFNESQLKKELNHSNCEFYFLRLGGQVLKKENEVVGYLKLNVLDAQSEFMSAEYLEIERIYVLKQFHKEGFGKMLVDFAKKKAFEKRKKKIWLGVWEKNPNAIGFYLKMGFEKTGTHIFKVGEEEQLDFVMELKVGS